MIDIDSKDVHANYLVLLATRFCPQCSLQKAAACDMPRCTAIASLQTTCLKSSYTLGAAFAREYVVKDGYDLTDPRRYDFDLMSREELGDLLRRNA